MVMMEGGGAPVAEPGRTEKATDKRREEARKRGQVARSQEVGIALGLLTSFGVLMAMGVWMFTTLRDMTVTILENAGASGDLSTGEVWSQLGDGAITALLVTAPVAVAMMIVGVLASAIQVKPQITPEAIKPRFSLINPINGFKRIFSRRSLVTIVKDLLKIAIISGATWFIVGSDLEGLAALTGASAAQVVSVGSILVLKIGFTVAVAYLVIAAADLLYERWQYEKDLRMTKDEVRRENKDQEVSQEVKGFQRRRQREAAMRRMLADVPQADVVITNPTHYAVAIRYTRAFPAPMVIAKGVDEMARRIREVADEHDVMIMESPPLARAIYAEAEIGEMIPPEHFMAVAEILAAVYRATGREPAAA